MPFRCPPEAVAHDPSPSEALAAVEELEKLMRQLKPTQQRILQLRLQGVSVEEIAETTDRTTRTVYRVLENIRLALEARLSGDGNVDGQTAR